MIDQKIVTLFKHNTMVNHSVLQTKPSFKDFCHCCSMLTILNIETRLLYNFMEGILLISDVKNEYPIILHDTLLITFHNNYITYYTYIYLKLLNTKLRKYAGVKNMQAKNT